MLLAIIILILSILLIWLYFKYFKVFKLNAVSMITGGVKTGKSTLAVYLAVKKHAQRVRLTKFINFFLPKKKKRPLPLLYSNIPLAVPYVPFTENLLLRQDRFVYGSVCYLGEISLISNSMNYQDVLKNEKQLLFYKLFGHETRGGLLICDTQCIADCHYSIKRSISEYLHILKCYKFFPFFIALKVQERAYSEDGSTVQNNIGDVTENTKLLLIPKKVWKLFDAYCYSFLTDNLAVECAEDIGINKQFEVVSFNKYKTLYEVKKCVKE